jgi:hypothetical protein
VAIENGPDGAEEKARDQTGEEQIQAAAALITGAP